MAMRNIVKTGDDVLLKKARRVERFDRRLHALLDDMLETMRAANGVGLAGPQVGILRQIVVIEVEEGKPIELINPQIIEADRERGLLELPGRIRHRHAAEPRARARPGQERRSV